jgi:hypothetical protein
VIGVPTAFQGIGENKKDHRTERVGSLNDVSGKKIGNTDVIREKVATSTPSRQRPRVTLKVPKDGEK